MTEFKLTRRQLIAAGVATYAMSSTAWAAYPEKPVRWIVGYPPGGATDTIARLLAQSMSSVIGQPIVIDNRPGAGSSLGATVLATSAPDGYTIGSADNGTLIINPVVYCQNTIRSRARLPACRYVCRHQSSALCASGLTSPHSRRIPRSRQIGGRTCFLRQPRHWHSPASCYGAACARR